MSGYRPGYSSGRIGLSQPATALAILIFFLATVGATTRALAQNNGSDETFNTEGAVIPKLALTEAQKAAIYKAVLQQHVRSTTGDPVAVPASVGAPVSPAVELNELPDQAAAEVSVAVDLKYAMVADDVVVVDPIGMRVVEVIHGSARR